MSCGNWGNCGRCNDRGRCRRDFDDDWFRRQECRRRQEECRRHEEECRRSDREERCRRRGETAVFVENGDVDIVTMRFRGCVPVWEIKERGRRCPFDANEE